MLVGSSKDTTIRVWDLSTIEKSNKKAKVGSPFLDIAVWKKWKANTSLPPDYFAGCKLLQGHIDWVWCCCFSPDGKYLASGGGKSDMNVRIWDHEGKCLRELKGHEHAVGCVAFSPDGSLLASGSDDYTLRLWNPHTGSCVTVLKGHTSYIWSCAFSPCGALLASAAQDNTIRIWNASSSVEQPSVVVLTEHKACVRSVVFSPNGQFMASASNDHSVRIWRVERPIVGSRATYAITPHAVLTGHTNDVQCCAFSTDGSLLASASHDGTVRLWSRGMTNDFRCVRVLTHNSSVVGVSFARNGHVMATASRDQRVRLWRMQEKQDVVKVLDRDMYNLHMFYDSIWKHMASHRDGDDDTCLEPAQGSGSLPAADGPAGEDESSDDSSDLELYDGDEMDEMDDEDDEEGEDDE